MGLPEPVLCAVRRDRDRDRFAWAVIVKERLGKNEGMAQDLHGLDLEFPLQEILTMIGEYPARQVLELAPNRWVETRSRLIEAGQLRYIDLARVTGSGCSRLTGRNSEVLKDVICSVR